MKKHLTLADLQKIILIIYSIPDDQLYTVEDLLYYGQKFILRAIKNLESKDKKTAIENFTVALAWFLALMNRFHFDLESLTWKRYSFKCPFCLEIPCDCRDKEVAKAKKTGRPSSRKPKTVKDWQEMVARIYPDEDIDELLMVFLRKNDDLSYSFRLFLKERQMKHFKVTETKSADFLILFMRLFCAIDADMNKNFYLLFNRGCHVCRKVPCVCNYF